MTTKFERDKVYKTRDGREDIRVVCVDGPGPYPIVGLKNGGAYTWTADGWYSSEKDYSGGQKFTHPWDLMLPKPEPIVEWEWGTIRAAGLRDDGRFDPEDSEGDARVCVASSCGRRKLAKRYITTEIVE